MAGAYYLKGLYRLAFSLSAVFWSIADAVGESVTTLPTVILQP